ncbi:MAG: hypothetical protein IPP48_01305 [Chitinophagaceae bacterium]|nr:hypothetical protein [Chitinophagaceae bacterium]
MYYNKEVQKLTKSNNEILEVTVIEEMNIHSFLGKIAEADAARKKATLLVEKSQNVTNKIKLLLAISNFYLAQKNKELYAKYFDSAATIIESVKSPELAAEGFSLLADMSSQNGDYKTAYRMSKLMVHYKEKFRTENIDRISAELKNESETDLKEKEIEYLSLVNKYKEEQLSKEELKRMALLREGILKDSSLANQKLLMAAMQSESDLRNIQLVKEKELRLSLSRENELKQKLLTDERKIKDYCWLAWPQ